MASLSPLKKQERVCQDWYCLFPHISGLLILSFSPYLRSADTVFCPISQVCTRRWPLSEWSFHSESSRHCLSKTVRTRELKFWENAHLPLCVTFHVSHITCHKSGVRCQVSGVRCQISGVRCHMSNFFLQSAGVSQWRVCYQRGLPRLVLISLQLKMICK